MLRDRVSFYISVVFITILTSCSGSKSEIIPAKTMTFIVGDLYMADQFIAMEPRYKGEIDSLVLYEAVLERYGYTFQDYANSTEYYLQRGDMLKRIHLKAKENLTKRRDELSALNAKKKRYEEFIEPYKLVNINDLWKDPSSRAIFHLLRLSDINQTKLEITDTTEWDIPQNPKWWIYNFTAPAMADSLYPLTIRRQKLEMENSRIVNSKFGLNKSDK